jgi:hypothetical protein
MTNCLWCDLDDPGAAEGRTEARQVDDTDSIVGVASGQGKLVDNNDDRLVTDG